MLSHVGGGRHLAAPLGLVARYVRPQAEDGRVLVEPEVCGPDGQALEYPKSGPEHDAHGHPDLVARRGCHERRGLFRSEVIGKFPGCAGHGVVVFKGFPQRTLQDLAGRGRPARHYFSTETGRLVEEIGDFRKELMLPEEECSHCLAQSAFLTFNFVPVLFTRNGSSGGRRPRHILMDARLRCA